MFGIFRKNLLFGLQNGSGKIKQLCRGFFNTLLGKASAFFYFQHVYKRSSSFCCNVLKFYFYIFENLNDMIIFLDTLLSLIGALFKCLFYKKDNFNITRQIFPF